MPTVIAPAPNLTVTTAEPRHPLERVGFGKPRTNMIHMYFNGYHYFGLYGEQLRVIYRPTEITPDGQFLGPDGTSENAFHCNIRFPKPIRR